MNENKKMTSIARRINNSFWLKRLGDVIYFNILLIVLVAGTFFYWCEKQVPESAIIYEHGFEGKNSYDELTYVIETSVRSYEFDMSERLDYLIWPAIILLIAEMAHLFFALFNTGEIRQKLRPLNELARKAEEISTVSLDTEKFSNLEQAISEVSVDGAEVKVSTGDKDLQSIEVALNNLLYRMKESQKQQTRFVSDASHELRTPISVIQGYVNMLDRWGKEDKNILDESIEALKHESEHMKDLVEQLLFLARGDSGRNTLKKNVFNLTLIMQEVWEESMMIDEEHVYTFSGQEDCYMEGDIAMVKQSMRIFIQNAAKYSNKGAEIKLAVKKKEGQVTYSVQDEGIGFMANEVTHIFERFYRSDEARNENTGGSGLGLSIAKWIVDAHLGNINVLTRPELGTRFTISFDMAKNSEYNTQIVQ